MIERIWGFLQRYKPQETSSSPNEASEHAIPTPDIMLSEEIKAIYPDKMTRDAILRAYTTGRMVIIKDSSDSEKS